MTTTIRPELEDALRRGAEGAAVARRRRRRLAAGSGTLALAGIAAALVVGIGSGGRLDVVAEARAALAPATGQIVHIDWHSSGDTLIDGKAVDKVGQAAIGSHMAVWYTDRPRRYRAQIFASQQERYGHPIELPWQYAYADGAQTTYDEYRGYVRTITGFNRNGSAAHLPTGLSVGNTLDRIRELLAAGTLRDGGAVTVGGREVRRLIGPERGALQQKLGTDDHGTIEYDVDPDTFAPVRVVTRHQFTSDARGIFGRAGQAIEEVSVMTIDAFDRLDPTPANQALLTIHPKPGTPWRTVTREQAVIEGHRKVERMNREGRKNLHREQARRAAARAKAKAKQTTP